MYVVTLFQFDGDGRGHADGQVLGANMTTGVS
jgi:hypothetical protein